jgi:hypothetical protein
MKPTQNPPSSAWRQQFVSCVTLAAILVAVLSSAERPARAGGTVTSCTAANLRAAMAGGGTVTFACDGTITLSNTISNTVDTVLDGSGHEVTISGGNTCRVFCVNTNVVLSLVNLIVANGYATNGAGILNNGGTLNLSRVVFKMNSAFGEIELPIYPQIYNPPICGGAIFNQSGTVCATNCGFFSNRAEMGVLAQRWAWPYPPPITSGGAIHNNGGNLRLQSCVFSNNQAVGGNNGVCEGDAGPGQGGAIFDTGVAVIDDCYFVGNSAIGRDGETAHWITDWSYGQFGGTAEGGAIFSSGNLTINRSAYCSNSAVAGIGGLGQVLVLSPYAVYGGDGGVAEGAAIYSSGSLILQNTTLAANLAIGGKGGAGGNFGSVNGSPPETGGSGGAGGSAAGGAVFDSGNAQLVNVTLVLNSAAGGDGGPGGTGENGSGGPMGIYGGDGGRGGNGGSGFGGICDTSGLLRMTNCTVTFNCGTFGLGGTGGLGGLGPLPHYLRGATGATGTTGISAGGIKTVSGVFCNTLLSSNTASNCRGAVTDAGHNLSSDASCAFTNVGSLNNTDPKLGPVCDNGGPTLTLALLPGSPAIDAGSAVGAPATDQRGVPRPQGAGVDIGAFEYLYSPVFTGATIQGATNRQMQLSGLTPNQPLTLQASANLADWWNLTNFTAGANGAFQCVDPISGTTQRRFYRLKAGTP